VSELERRLHEAARYYEFPPTPPLVDVAARRLPSRPRRPLRRVVAVALAVALAAAGAVALTPGARSALLDVLDVVPGVEVRRTEKELPAAVPFFSFEETLGRRVSLEEARRTVGFQLRLPEQLSEPDRVYLDRGAEGGAVTAVYGGAGRRAQLVLTQWHPVRLLFRKLLVRGTDVETVDLDGGQALWISNGDHEVFYVGVDQRRYRAAGYLAGNTLIWQRGAITYRLEGNLVLEHALELARSLRAS
jgi:hypothetical protein